jgi:hypothetical protein
VFGNFTNDQLVEAKAQLEAGILRYQRLAVVCEALDAACERIEDEIDRRRAMALLDEIEAEERDLEDAFGGWDRDDRYEWVVEQRYEAALRQEARS